MHWEDTDTVELCRLVTFVSIMLLNNARDFGYMRRGDLEGGQDVTTCHHYRTVNVIESSHLTIMPFIHVRLSTPHRATCNQRGGEGMRRDPAAG